MKAEEIRTLSTDEIRERIREEEEQLQQLRFQHAVATLTNPTLLRVKRREIARLKTILSDKQEA